jgi:nitroreductase
MSEFIKAMKFRHACKLFDDKRKISKKEINAVLEAGRLSPSSFGLEPWHFLVIESAKVKKALEEAFFGQPQVATSSHLVILLSRKAKFFKQTSEYLDEAFGRIEKDIKAVESGKRELISFLENDLEADVTSWAKMQAYIAGANMMTAAAALGIDSCPLEGFNAKKLKAALAENIPEFDKKSYKIALAIAFGYRAGEQTDQIRRPLEKIATFVK